MKRREVVLFVISLLVFFEPQIFKEESVFFATLVDNIYKILKIFCAAIVGVKYLKYIKMPSKLILLTCILQFITFLSTIINKGDIIRFIGPAVTTIAMAMISEILIKKEGLLQVLKKVNIYFRIIFIINIISIILIDFTDFKQFCNVYFLGIDNRFIFTFLPWILFEGITSYIEYGRLRKSYYICFIGCEIILFYRFSLSAMLSLLLFAIPIVSKINLSRFKNTAFISMIIANIELVVCDISKYLSKSLSFFSRDVTLSGRTFIWNGAIETIKNSPLIGSGMKSLIDDKVFFYNSTSPYYLEFCKVSHPHNSLVAIAYRGGILALVVYLIIFYRSLRNLKRNKNHKLSNLLFISLIIIIITSLFDTMDFSGLYFVFGLCCFIDKIKYKEVSE